MSLPNAESPAIGADTEPEHFDVLIVGAGVSGIGCGCHLRRSQPGKSYVILEARGASGGTWDLFRYPGVRSDSDLHTFGYEFKPWRDEKAIAEGPAILNYVREAGREHAVDEHVRLHHRVTHASWDSREAHWTVTAVRTDTGEALLFTCAWLFCAAGYFRYDEGHTPPFAGRERFQGQLVHPQQWPAELDYEGKRVVVIGSGATAITLVPAMAQRARHVTMLQRSPTYVVSVPAHDAIANALNRVLPARAAYALTRRKNIWLQQAFYKLSRSRPQLVRRRLSTAAKRMLPEGYAVDVHFKPRYKPWDQRLCLVPDGDLFEAIRRGRVTLETDEIEGFTETGIQLASGGHLEADVIVSATGLQLLALGGMRLTVDGREVELAHTLAYKAMMLSDVPNFVFALGYTNASWTLKVDLVCGYLCRLLAHMDAHGYASCAPHNDDPDLPTRPLLDLASGYVQRAVHEWPRQGTSPPWSLTTHTRDVKSLRRGPIEDGVLRFSRAGAGNAHALPRDTGQLAAPLSV